MNLLSQLTEQALSWTNEEVLAEVPKVQRTLATHQFCNSIITNGWYSSGNERIQVTFQTRPKEIKDYVLGLYGQASRQKLILKWAKLLEMQKLHCSSSWLNQRSLPEIQGRD